MISLQSIIVQTLFIHFLTDEKSQQKFLNEIISIK